MPNYADPAARIGTAVGLGGTALASTLDALDAPRRWLWRNTIGTESGTEALGKLGMNTESPFTKALGLGAELAFDPLSLVGGAVTKGLRGLGRAAGRGLEAAAYARGPRFGGDSLHKIFGAPGLPPPGERPQSLQALLADLADLPDEMLRRAGQEIPSGSQYLGHGAEALVLRTPGGNALRIQPMPAAEDIGRLARPDIPEMLQANRAGMAGDIRLEHTPLADTSYFSSLRQRGRLDPMRHDMLNRDTIVGDMERIIASRGYSPIDIHAGNLGRVGGEVKVIDPGAVLPPLGRPGAGALIPPPLPQWVGGKQPGRFTNWLLDRLGSDRAIRRELGEL